MTATPAGSDKTPLPTHPLIKLKAAAAIVCSFDLESSLSLLVAVAAAEDAFIRKRGRDNDSIPTKVRGFLLIVSYEAVVVTARSLVTAIAEGPPIKKASDDVDTASINTERMAMALITFIVIGKVLLSDAMFWLWR